MSTERETMASTTTASTEFHKHTPGPWTIERCGCGNATCSSYFVSVTRSDGRLALPDARLIAAAPELLAACKEIAEDTLTEAMLAASTKRALEAAIAKAEGR